MMRTIGMARAVMAGAASLALVVAAAWLAAPDSSRGTLHYAECTFSPATGVLHVRIINNEEGLVRRHGNRIAIREPDGTGGYNTVACDGGQATA